MSRYCACPRALTKCRSTSPLAVDREDEVKSKAERAEALFTPSPSSVSPTKRVGLGGEIETDAHWLLKREEPQHFHHIGGCRQAFVEQGLSVSLGEEENLRL